MKIAVVNTHVPFTRGGAETHAGNLVEALRRHGHEVELVQIPFNWRTPWSVMDHLMAARLLDLEHVNGKEVDQVIGLRFPAYHVRHPRKVLWIIHQYRSAFDFWADPRADLAQQEGGRAVRDGIRLAERRLLQEARAIYANSDNVAGRLERFCGQFAVTLYHPPGLAHLLRPGLAGDYFLCPGRIEPLKRQEFVVESLAHCRQPVHIQFAGAVGSEHYWKQLQRRVAQLGLERRVRWCGYVSDGELAGLYADCLGVVYAPHDEDYGYVALEAQLSAKPVFTTQMAGGVLEFVNDQTGWVSGDDPVAFAAQLDAGWSARHHCAEKGSAGREAYLKGNISWERVVETLVTA